MSILAILAQKGALELHVKREIFFSVLHQDIKADYFLEKQN